MTSQRIGRALEWFRAGKQDLYTDDGQKLYSDEEHERRLEALLAEFDHEKDSVVSEADRTIANAERNLALEHRDLSDSLTTTELERANAKTSYVEDDVWSLSSVTLLKRARAAQAAGDQPTIFSTPVASRSAQGWNTRMGPAKRARSWRPSPQSLLGLSGVRMRSVIWRERRKQSGMLTA